jgi:CSLREA domain-containing protein
MARSVGVRKLLGLTVVLGAAAAVSPASAGVRESATPANGKASAVYNVNTTQDGNLVNASSTSCVAAVDTPQKCSLRAAIEAAANRSSTTSVTIHVPAGHYKLTVPNLSMSGTDLEVNTSGPLEIVGAGSGSSIVDANFLDRAFLIESEASVVISGLTIENGRTDDLGPVTSCPSSPSSSSENGGGILQQSGTLTLDQDVITGNMTPGLGGGIDDEGPGALTLNGTAVTHNISCANSQGEHGGGGIDTFDGAPLTIRSSTISGNVAQSGSGGGIIEPESANTTKIFNTTISGNKAENGNGGGIAAKTGGTYVLFGDLFVHNSATGNADSQTGYGGAFDNSLNATDSFVNTTFVGNSAQTDGGGIEAGEGAYAPSETISFSTLDGNSSANGTGNIGTASDETGGASLDDSIVINGHGGNCSGPLGFADNGNNLFDDTSDHGMQCGSTPLTHDVVTASPKVGSLADNGGPTETEALQGASLAIDRANTSKCTSETKSPTGSQVDQRGVPRPEGPKCDIGAFEATPNLGITASTSKSSILVGQQDTITDVVDNSGPPNATNSTFTDPAAGTLIDSVSSTQGTCSHTMTRASCNLGTVPTGHKVRITIVLTGLTPGTIRLNSDTGTSGDDLDLSNNRAAVSLKVKPTPKPPPPGPPKGRPTITLARVSPACYRPHSRIRIDATATAGVGIRTMMIEVSGHTIYTFQSHHSPTQKTVKRTLQSSKLKSGRTYPVAAIVVDDVGRTARAHARFAVCKAPAKRGFTG